MATLPGEAVRNEKQTAENKAANTKGTLLYYMQYAYIQRKILRQLQQIHNYDAKKGKKEEWNLKLLKNEWPKV